MSLLSKSLSVYSDWVVETMGHVSLRALRAHWLSAVGVFLTMLLAAALIFASGTLIESGLRSSEPFSPTATILPSMMASFGGIAVMIAVFVVSTVFAAALRDRQREFALLRAVGATGNQIRGLVSREVMLISTAGIVAGSVAGFGGAYALVPLLKSNGIVGEDFSPVVSVWPLLGAALLLLPAAWLAGVLAARDMAKLSPTSAVSTSSTEGKPLARGRIVAAWVCAAGGALATLTPVFIPGALGGAAGAASALLFITAVALAGPALVLRGATWASQRTVLRARAASLLATVNARGYSRRLTAAVVPLALLVSLGTIQTGMNSIVTTAAEQQLGDALGGQLVWQAPGVKANVAPSASDTSAALRDLPGVTDVAVTQMGMVHVKVEDTGDMDFEGLAWEPASLRMVSSATHSPLIDPNVTDGNLAALSGSDTIAVATDSLAFTGKGVGDRIGVRYPDGTDAEPVIVAVYDRGLGLGGLIVDEDGFAPAAVPGVGATAVIQVADGEQAAVSEAAEQAGMALISAEVYVNHAMDTGQGGNQLGDTLLLALLAFIGIAAGNALAVATRARGDEFALLGRIGATTGQMRSMLTIEGALVAIGAVAIGTLTALPGLTAASLSLIDGFQLGLDLTVYAALAAAATAVAFIGMTGARLRVKV